MENTSVVRPFIPQATQELMASTDPISREREKAAQLIQKHVRGHLVRKSFLPSSLYERYRPLLMRLKETNFEGVDRASCGSTSVYFPREMPEVIFKASGEARAVTRWNQMERVRSILREQGSSHLVVPRANLCESFLIEERLPIAQSVFDSMECYLAQPRAFDLTVREATRLFSRVYLDDLLGGKSIGWNHLSRDQLSIRYDNFPLYLEAKGPVIEGKIGLIDLESIEDTEDPQEALCILARIFPLHIEMITEEARKLGMNFDESKLQEASEAGREYLENGFSGHKDLLERKGITFQNFDSPFQVSRERLPGIIEKVFAKLTQQCPLFGGMSWHQRSFWNLDFLDSQYNLKDEWPCVPSELPKDQFKAFLDQAIPMAIEHIGVIIRLAQNATKESPTFHGVHSFGDVLKFRSPKVSFKGLYAQSVYPVRLPENPVVSLIRSTLRMSDHEKAREFSKWIVCSIMDVLVEGGDIFLFDQDTGYDDCWVRY